MSHENKDYKARLIKKIAQDNKNYKYYESLVKPKKVYKRSDKNLTSSNK